MIWLLSPDLPYAYYVLGMVALIIFGAVHGLRSNTRRGTEFLIDPTDNRKLLYAVYGGGLLLITRFTDVASIIEIPIALVLVYYAMRFVDQYVKPPVSAVAIDHEGILQARLTDMLKRSEVPFPIKHRIAEAYSTRLWDIPEKMPEALTFLAKALPPADMIGEPRPGAPTWGNYTWQAWQETEDTRYPAMWAVFSEDIQRKLKDIPISITLPEHLRIEHMQVVASSGWGKSQFLTNQILADVAAGHSVVVIDSQNDLINSLAVRVPPERLILVDPANCAPALNMFDQPDDEYSRSTAIELYEYIFRALESDFTTKQATVYRFLSELVMTVRGNIHTMRELLEPDGTQRYRLAIESLSPTAQAFFREFEDQRQYGSTKQEILRRLFTLLSNPTMERMLGAERNVIDMRAAIDRGMVVLVSTDKAHLKQTSASLLGRIFIAQVMQAVGKRTDRKRTYLYIDEFQDYAEDSHVLFNLFEQARKYGLGLIVAHQYLGQLPPQLQQSIAANTAIKFAGGVSAADARSLASQMHTTAEIIQKTPKGMFLGHFRGLGTFPYPVEIGKVDTVPTHMTLTAIHARMKALFTLPPRGERPQPRDSGEAEERGRW